MKLNPLRQRANRRPSSFISSGKVTTPIIVSVVIKVAIMPTAAPAFSKVPLSGKAMIAGICRTAPIKPVANKPVQPERALSQADNRSGVASPRINPINTTTIRIEGNIFRNERQAITNACRVFSRPVNHEIIRQPRVKILIRIVVLLIKIHLSEQEFYII